MNRKLFGTLALLTLTAGLVGGVVGAWIASPNPAFAQGRTSSVETSELRLVDTLGNIRALMDLDESGNPRMMFLDGEGNIRLWAGLTPADIAMLNLRDTEGESRVFVQVDGTTPLITMRDSAGVGRVYMQVSNDQPLLNLRNKADTGGVFVKVADDGPVLWFSDDAGKTTYHQR